ncbi:MAG: OprO/OprP family phosphate-selective porin [Azoarcus sp.]|jgi:hypothetical protein|nr:OprO/OprP family phosphate-selective porin [Azoarcus sp.]
MQSKILVAALACAFAWPASATADNTQLAAELAALQEQIAQMRTAYEGRIAALEEKLAAADKRRADDATTPAQTASQARSQAPVAHGGASAFNPEISLILQGAYKRAKEVEERHIGGFVGAAHHHDGDEHGDDKRGFLLDHSELVLAANIDPHFRGQTTVALLDGEAELEEAWFQTTSLGHGVGIRAGRFFSGIGYLNEQHAHQWDFYEQPLMYKALFGEHGYSQDGVQLKWVAPLATFLEFGAEIGRGQNFPGTERNLNGANSRALFAHVGGDIGTSSSWRAGLSWLQTRAEERENHFESEVFGEAHGAFSGRSRVWIADFVYKWAPDGNPARRNFKLQAEYFHRKENGHLAVEDEESPWRTRQSGYYLAGVYQFTPNWRAGLRYDRLDSGRQFLGDNPAGIEIEHYQPRRVSAMVDYSWSEFSRLRLQLSRDRAMPGVIDNQVMLQYVMSLGSHGAHKF